MLPLPPFSLIRPRSLDEATRALVENPGAKLISGGTDLLPSMKQGLFSPPALIALSRAGLGGLREEGDELVIGAGTTLRQLAQDPRCPPALREACRTVATPTIQAAATLGGNLALDTRCHWYNQSERWRTALGGCLKCEAGSPDTICHVAPKGTGCYAAQSADTVPALVLLGARVEIASLTGRRVIPLLDLFDEDGRSWLKLAPGELIAAVRLPRRPPEVVHRKVRARASIDYGLLLTAVSRSEGGFRAVFGAVGPRPVVVELGADRAEAPEIAFKSVFPLATHTWPSTWRKKMVRVEVKRALEQLP